MLIETYLRLIETYLRHHRDIETYLRHHSAEVHARVVAFCQKVEARHDFLHSPHACTHACVCVCVSIHTYPVGFRV